MSDIATTEPARGRNAPQTARRDRISPRIAEAIRLLATGTCSTQKAAAERAGINETYFSEVLRKPKIRAFYERAARETIAAGQLPAAGRLIGLINAASEHVSLDAAKHVLAIAGIKPAETAAAQVNVNVSAGYVIDLGAGAAAVDVTPDKPHDG